MLNSETISGQQWDGVVSDALASSGVDGTVMLAANAHAVAIPFGLPALISGLLHFVAPEAPHQLRVYTYEVLNVGCLLEVRGGRELTSLPEQLTELATRMGVRLHFFRQAKSSSVLLNLPTAV